MVLEITPELRQDLVRIVVAAVRSDIDELINLAYKLDMLEYDVSPSVVREAAQAIISIHFDRQLTQRQIQEITYQILGTFYRFPLRLPSSFVYILRAGVWIEGIGLAYDPNFNSLSTAIPIYKRIVARALGAKSWPTVNARVVKDGMALDTMLTDKQTRI